MTSIYSFAIANTMSMPSADKPEEVSREEWIQRLQNTHITRADMNKLIMNYLVTGMDLFIIWFVFFTS